MDEREFEIVRSSLSRQMDEEILGLKEKLNGINKEDLEDADTAAKAVLWIFQAMNGLKKLCAVMEYIDCWEDNGDPPNLSAVKDIQTFMKEDTEEDHA